MFWKKSYQLSNFISLTTVINIFRISLESSFLWIALSNLSARKTSPFKFSSKVFNPYKDEKMQENEIWNDFDEDEDDDENCSFSIRVFQRQTPFIVKEPTISDHPSTYALPSIHPEFLFLPVWVSFPIFFSNQPFLSFFEIWGFSRDCP